MQKTLAEIAEMVGGEVVGNKDLILTGLNGLQEAKKGDLSFLATSKYLSLTKKTQASAIIVGCDIEISNIPVIKTENPSLAFSKIASQLLENSIQKPKGIHKTAVISDSAQLGDHVAVGPLVVIEDGVRIGSHTEIHAGSYIGHQTMIGDHCQIYPNVTIREKITIGCQVIIHSGSVVGSDGYGYEMENGKHIKIPQMGTVVVGDDVEIGSNVTIDRARFDRTVIGSGTKVDNLVQIAHNVQIGENCIIIAQTGISGSVKIGKGSILAGQSGVAGHLTIGEGSIVASQAGVTKSIPPHSKVIGFPARPHEHAKRVNAHVQRLPKTIKKMNDRIKKLEEKLNQSE